MKKFLLLLLIFLLNINSAFAFDFQGFLSRFDGNNQEKSVRRFLDNQVKYANKANLKKFIATYDDLYKSDDGLDKNRYSKLVQDIWNTYGDIEYSIDVKNITVNDDKAVVELIEHSYAEIAMTDVYVGELKSTSDSVYYLQKNKSGKWTIISDRVKDECTTMLYGAARGLDVKLTVPEKISSNTDYIATLEFVPPAETIAIASLAADKIDYPQKPAKEIFRALPEDNILERFFTSNGEDINEYVVASIGLTKTSIADLSLKLSLTGFGYVIKRVNVVPEDLKGTLSVDTE